MDPDLALPRIHDPEPGHVVFLAAIPTNIGFGAPIRRMTVRDLRAALEAMREEDRAQLLDEVGYVDWVARAIEAEKDAARAEKDLMELRATIDDHLGWATTEDEDAGDYVARIKQFADAAFDSVPRSTHEELSRYIRNEIEGLRGALATERADHADTKRRTEESEKERDRARGDLIEYIDEHAALTARLARRAEKAEAHERENKELLDEAEASLSELERMRPVIEKAEKITQHRLSGPGGHYMVAGIIAQRDLLDLCSALDEYRKGGGK